MLICLSIYLLYFHTHSHDFLFHKYVFIIDPIWNLTTAEEGYTYVAYEGDYKLPRLSSTR